jgi:genome maintenance exonuclease 1
MGTITAIMPNFAYYQINGRNVNRVTSILKATENPESKKRLQAWKKRVGEAESERRSKEATERGTALHSMCESYLRGQDVVCLNDVALPYWYSIKGELANITDVIALETQVHHDKYNYAGSFDCFGTYHGITNTVIDFKTAAKPKETKWISDYFIQCAAYAGALASQCGYPVNQAAVIVALSDRQCQKFVLTKDELLYYWGQWIKRLELFERLQSE